MKLLVNWWENSTQRDQIGLTSQWWRQDSNSVCQSQPVCRITVILPTTHSGRTALPLVNTLGTTPHGIRFGRRKRKLQSWVIDLCVITGQAHDRQSLSWLLFWLSSHYDRQLLSWLLFWLSSHYFQQVGIKQSLSKNISKCEKVSGKSSSSTVKRW